MTLPAEDVEKLRVTWEAIQKAKHTTWKIVTFEELADALKQAQELVASDYQSTSNKYKHVSRLPPGETAVEALCRHEPSEVQKIRDEIEQRAASTYRRMGYARKDGMELELTAEQYAAFKQAGGRSSW